MRVIKRKVLCDYWKLHRGAKDPLIRWFECAEAAKWDSIHDVRATFPSADSVRVGSGRTVTVFNISGNKYRLITAIHYNKQRVYTLLVCTHNEYNNGHWRNRL